MEQFSLIFAQASPGGGGSGLGGFLPILIMFAAMYFLLIAPQRKKQKQHQKMVCELASGAHVLTSVGIYGTITNVKDDRFVLRIAEGTKIEITKNTIASVISSDDTVSS